jgi:hypothetical protein
MNTPIDLLWRLAQAFRAMAPDRYDHWRDLAGSLERYADGTEEFADLLRVRRHREDILRNDVIEADHDIVADWLKNLKEPRRGMSTPRESSAVR